MQDDDESRGTGPDRQAGRESSTDRLARLAAALDARRSKSGASVDFGFSGASPGLARALTLGTEFIGAILAGAGFGLGFDYLVGSRPLGLILFLLLGFAAGVLIVIRSAAKLGGAPRTQDDKAETSGKGHEGGVDERGNRSDPPV